MLCVQGVFSVLVSVFMCVCSCLLVVFCCVCFVYVVCV